MKKALALLLLAAVFVYDKPQQKTSDKDIYRAKLKAHPFSVRPRLTTNDLREIPKEDRPDLAWEQNFLATMDPVLGRPAPERLIAVHQQVAAMQNSLMAVPGAASSPWVERGPTNVSGRTRAIIYDPNDATGKKVWAGGVSGGLWYNNDITSSSSSWVAVDDFWDNLAITAIAFDPTNTNIMYIGTGEGWGQSSGTRGAGIWKSTDGGNTWSHLSASSGFYFVNDLAVRNESGNGVLYVALRGSYKGNAWHGSADQGLQRSTNGGTSFTQVMPNVPGESINYAAADIEISSNNKLWVGTTTSSYSATDRGGGRILSSTNGTTWTVSYQHTGGERVKIACAPSDANYVYAMIEAGNAVDAIVRTTNNGSSWGSLSEPSDVDNGIPSNDFSRGQAWYDLSLAVDPNNKNTVIAGAIDLFRSTNGGSSWTQISKWSNNNNLFNLNCSLVHADQHVVLFKPGSSSEVLFGNDGGVFYTSNISSAATSNVIYHRNNGHNITQFYACAIHPNPGMDYFLAGAQDNGTQQFNTAGLNSTTRATSGDGAFCFIDQTNPSYQITSYVYNSYWLSTNGGLSFGASRIQSDQSTGKFINPTDYDDQQDVLYSARTSSTVNRISGISGSPSVDYFTVSGMGSMASHLRVSPYTTSSTTLFVGTEAGDLYKVTNADGFSPSATSIGSGLPAGNISCVEIGASENELLVTYTNYGLTSVWYTSNGGSTWTSKEGNLPDMPVRWALFNPNNRSEVILATEVGVWSTTNFSSASPTWTPSSSGLANVRVDMLQIRQSDNEVIAATHGRGLFSSSGFNASQAPVADFAASSGHPCTGTTVSLNDSSFGTPTSWSWSITPATFSYTNGTSSTSQNPEVIFNANGAYTIKLVVNNANGSDSLEVVQAVQAGGYSLPYTENFEGSSVSEWQVDNPDNSNTWGLYSVAGNTPGSTAAAVDNYNYNGAGQRDGLVSPAINLSNYTQATLNFEYAYRRYNSTYQDSLAVYISTDCGTNWSRIGSYREDGTGNFVTGADYNSSFSPQSAADWCGFSGNPVCPSIDISSYTGQANVRIKFENICGFGNNLFVDNINITGQLSPAPVADFSASATTTCQNTGLNFTDLSTNSPTSWSWSFSPNTVSYVNSTSASSQNPEVQFNAAGTYHVTLTSSNSYGSDSETKSGYITVNPSVTPTVNISSSTGGSICEGSGEVFNAIATNAGSSPSYQWKLNGVPAGSNSSSFYASNLQNNDVVSVVLTSSKSCAFPLTVSSQPYTAQVIPTPQISINTTLPVAPLCGGDTLVLSATVNSFGYAGIGNWSGPGVQNGRFIASLAGTGTHSVYYGYALINHSCSGYDSLQIVVENVPQPTITANGYVLTCNQTGYNYQWIKNGSAIPGATSRSYTVTGNGNYSVQIGLTNCSEQSQPHVVNDFGQDELKEILGFKLFPNPTSSYSRFELRKPGVSEIHWELAAADGTVVARKNIKASGTVNQEIDLHELPAGAYTLRIVAGDWRLTEKLIRQ